ncbi:uncharacterized protein [Musca autumnalis]|uniref:uncharacterized protein n=1 Tax=Musca autumnalis TaxID=221902 RepID=UPI003CF54DA8
MSSEKSAHGTSSASMVMIDDTKANPMTDDKDNPMETIEDTKHDDNGDNDKRSMAQIYGDIITGKYKFQYSLKENKMSAQGTSSASMAMIDDTNVNAMTDDQDNPMEIGDDTKNYDNDDNDTRSLAQVYSDIATGKSKFPYSPKENKMLVIKVLLSSISYKMEQKYLHLMTPTIDYVESLYPKCPMGFSETTTEKLREIFKQKPANERLCVLSFDRVKVKNDNIKYAYSFLLSGLLSNWKFLIGVAAKESYTVDDLKSMLSTVYTAARNIDVKIEFNVCDAQMQHTLLLAPLKKRNIYCEPVQGHRSLWGIDIIHFICNLVRAFLTSKISYRGSSPNFEYIKHFTKHANKWKKTYFYELFNIDHYCEIFNNNVVEYLTSCGPKEDLDATKELVSNMALFFHLIQNEETMCVEEKKSILEKFYNFLKELDFPRKRLYVPSIKAWKLLMEKHENILLQKCTSHFNIEQFFSKIRTCYEEKLTVENMLYVKSRNDAAIENAIQNKIDYATLFWTEARFPH